MTTVAIDLSPRATGWALGTIVSEHSGILRTPKNDSWFRTFTHVLAGISVLCIGAADVWIEQGFGSSFHGRSGGDIAELRGALRFRLAELGCPDWTEVPPTTLKVFATGMGHADKADMVAVVREWGFEVPKQISEKTGKPISKDEDGVADAIALHQFALACRTGTSHGNTAHALKWAAKKEAS